MLEVAVDGSSARVPPAQSLLVVRVMLQRWVPDATLRRTGFLFSGHEGVVEALAESVFPVIGGIPLSHALQVVQDPLTVLMREDEYQPAAEVAIDVVVAVALEPDAVDVTEPRTRPFRGIPAERRGHLHGESPVSAALGVGVRPCAAQLGDFLQRSVAMGHLLRIDEEETRPALHAFDAEGVSIDDAVVRVRPDDIVLLAGFITVLLGIAGKEGYEKENGGAYRRYSPPG